ncbi:hypothetical protein [Stutzerimonas azotifigens]|uniref:hypothetical protein n=1 Tax=Stutzerimonas azotifigens TaxID=291995 RepID=UPI001C6135AE|nr:hypothetical protein [Stutzerimonas azotifigens]
MTADTKRFPKALLAGLLLTTLPLAAHAYVGPGAGLGLLAALWGLLAAVGVAVIYIVMWPIRRMRRRRKAEQVATASSTSPVTETPVVQARQAEPSEAPVHATPVEEKTTGTHGTRL